MNKKSTNTTAKTLPRDEKGRLMKKLTIPEQIAAIPPREIPLMGVALVLDEWRRGNGYGSFARIPREIVDEQGGMYSIGRKDVDGQMPIITLTYTPNHSRRLFATTELTRTETELVSLIKTTDNLKRHAWELNSRAGSDQATVEDVTARANANSERIASLEAESKRLRKEIEVNEEIVWEFPISLEGYVGCLSIP